MLRKVAKIKKKKRNSGKNLRPPIPDFYFYNLFDNARTQEHHDMAISLPKKTALISDFFLIPLTTL